MRVLATNLHNPTYRDESAGSSRRASYDDDAPLPQGLGQFIKLPQSFIDRLGSTIFTN